MVRTEKFLWFLKRKLILSLFVVHMHVLLNKRIKRSICRLKAAAGEKVYCKFQFSFYGICKLCTDIRLYYLE